MTGDFPDKFNKLAERLKRGDRRAASEIFDHWHPKIFAFFLRKTGDRQGAEDLAQDIFIKVLTRIETFEPKTGAFSAWIWGISKNALIDHYREKKAIRFSEMKGPEEDEDEVDFPGKEVSYEDKIEVKRVLAAAESLDPDEKELFDLHHISGLSYSEISAIMGKSEAALRVYVHRLNLKLRKKLNEKIIPKI